VSVFTALDVALTVLRVAAVVGGAGVVGFGLAALVRRGRARRRSG
jgi:hypothetical protein